MALSASSEIGSMSAFDPKRTESGIADDYRNTHHMFEMLKPDIWLAQACPTGGALITSKAPSLYV
jgi:hypothetical protein